MFNYSEPTKMSNGFWETTVTRKDGKNIDMVYTCNIVQIKTKKGLADWIKKHKAENQ